MPRKDLQRREGRAALPLRMVTGIAFLGMGLLFAMIIVSAVPAFLQRGADSVFTWTWRPYQGEFGILAMISGSVLLAFSALLLAWPFAVALCCRLIAFPQSPLLPPVRCCVRLMTAMPTVVYAFAAIFLVTPLIRSGFGGSGFCWISAALVLALLVLPTLVLVLEAGLAPRLAQLCPGGLAIGFTRMELLWFFVLPQSRGALLAAALLGLGRAFGDTLIPLMLAGNAPVMPSGLGDSLRALTAHMALVTANEVGGAAYNSLFAAGALLLVTTTAVSLALRRLRRAAEKNGEAAL